MPTTQFIQYKESVIHCIKFGTGKKILIAFHGFSENAKSFLVLEPSLGKTYTIISIDIPYHGNTVWHEPMHFTTQHLIEIVQLYIERNAIKRFSVLGFSMGGKCALYVANAFAPQIDELFLLASDGIKTNKVYNVAVYPAWGRKLFKTTIKHPSWFFACIKLAHFFRLLTPWLYKFTFTHMETREKRQRLYDTWISMSEFNPDIKQIKEKLVKYNIQVFLFFGVRDEVIPINVAAYFAEGIPQCKLTTLERGHFFIDERLNPFIENVLAEKEIPL